MSDAYSLQHVERKSEESAPACLQAAGGLSQQRLRDCSRSVHGPCGWDQEGNYRGKLRGNAYDPDSTSNQFGRYGSPFSPKSLNNPYGAGSPFGCDSPKNPYGQGWKIQGSR